MQSKPDLITSPKRPRRKSKSPRFTIQSYAILERKLKSVSESEFRESSANDLIKRAKVFKTEEGYILVIEVTHKPGEYTLHTFRKRPRTWASLDRMMAFLERNELNVKSVTLEL